MRVVIKGGIFEIRIITFRCSGRVQLEVAILMKWEQIFSMAKDGSEFPGMDVMSLGTRTQIPTRHMLDTLGVQTISDSNVPSGQKLGLLKMYP